MDKRKEIEKLAYELFQRDGCTSGREIEHWLEAERIVQSRHELLAAEKNAGLESAAPPAAKTTPKEGKKVTQSKTVHKTKSARKSSAKGKVGKAGTSRKKSSL